MKIEDQFREKIDAERRSMQKVDQCREKII